MMGVKVQRQGGLTQGERDLLFNELGDGGRGRVESPFYDTELTKWRTLSSLEAESAPRPFADARNRV